MIHQIQGILRLYSTKIALVIATLILFAPLTYAAGFGISPAQIEVKNIYAGSRITRYFQLSRESVESEAAIGVTVEGAASSSFNVPSSIVFKRGELQKSIEVAIDTADLKNNTEYDAVLTFSSAQSEDGANRAPTQVLPSIKASARFTVTDKIINALTVKQVIVKENDERYPLRFSYLLSNEGNIEDHLSKITITVTDLTNKNNIYTQTIEGDQLSSIGAFSEKTIPLQTNLTLPTGRYTADFTFYKENALVFERNQYPVQVASKDGNLPPLLITSTKSRGATHGTRQSLVLFFGLSIIVVFGLYGLLRILITKKRLRPIRPCRSTSSRAKEKIE